MVVGEVKALLDSMRDQVGLLKDKRTVDRFIELADPDIEVTGIAVGWMSYRWALEEARRLGCNCFITHEPTYYDHLDSDPVYTSLRPAEEKRTFLRRNKMSVLRCHDLWDLLPGIGIPDSWVEFLSLGQPIGGEGYFRVIDVGDITLADLASRIVDRVSVFGQNTAQVIGDPGMRVHRLVVGTGAITPFHKFATGFGADVALCTDDGFLYWRDGALAVDTGFPVVVVHHHVAEESGMMNLAKYLQERVAVPVHHIAQKCPFWSVHPDTTGDR